MDGGEYNRGISLYGTVLLFSWIGFCPILLQVVNLSMYYVPISMSEESGYDCHFEKKMDPVHK